MNIRDDLNRFPSALQTYQYLSKYARWDPAKGRRETWSETVTRVIEFLIDECGQEAVPPETWLALSDAMLHLEALPSMRLIQMAGPAAKRCHVCIYNCSYLPLQDWTAFSEALYILMQGTGVGFSVERQYVDQLPTIQPQTGEAPTRYSIPDTTEGWCRAFLFGLQTWAFGRDVIFDFRRIRAAGARLATKGGRASGPEPLKQLLTFTRDVLLSRQGHKLRPIDAHDIACQLGAIVQVGGVRRAAEISIFDVDDEQMRHSKDGPFWETAPQRMQANNSAVFTEKPSASEFLEKLWLPLMKGGTGEPGILNRESLQRTRPARRQSADFGTNPCGEIALRPFEFCNLSIAVARPDDTEASLQKKVRLAAIFGTLQSMLTRFGYLRSDWASNCQEERLLGVDITGWMDCPLLANPHPFFLERLKAAAITTNSVLAQDLKIPISASVTCVKPSGNSSTLLGCSPGVHPREAPFYLRRVRAGRLDPLTRLLQDAGVPWAPDNGQTRDDYVTAVFEFPCASPAGAPTYKEVDAYKQFEHWLCVKRNWTEHNPSCTIRVRPEEWLGLGATVHQHWDEIGGLSFLPYSDHVYPLAPYEALTEVEYQAKVAAFPEIPWEKLSEYETEDHTTVAGEFACVSGGCTL